MNTALLLFSEVTKTSGSRINDVYKEKKVKQKRTVIFHIIHVISLRLPNSNIFLTETFPLEFDL